MKKQLTAIFLIISFCSYGQGISGYDSISINSDTSMYLLLKKGAVVDSFPFYYMKKQLIEPLVYDTVPIIMLVSDTSYPYELHSSVGCISEPCEVSNDFKYAFYKYGYLVKEYIPPGTIINDAINIIGYCRTRDFLDEKKKPLPTNYIVWQSIER